jgi:hypothetical protein
MRRNISTTFTSFTLWYVLHQPPLVPTLHAGTILLSCSLFMKNKKKFFCLFKGVSLWHLPLYMYYNSNWFILSIFSLSTLVPFLWWFQQV